VSSPVLCPTRMPVRLVSLPLFQTLPSTVCILVPSSPENLWQPSPIEVMRIKVKVFGILCPGSQAVRGQSLQRLEPEASGSGGLNPDPWTLTSASYFSLATTNSGAQRRARLISESGKKQIDLQADSAYCAARVVAASSEP